MNQIRYQVLPPLAEEKYQALKRNIAEHATVMVAGVKDDEEE